MNDLSLYFKSASKTKLLTKDQEIDLAQKIEKGDKFAKNEMVAANLRLAISIARKYQNKGVELEDLIQEANIGLIKAVERFEWRKGFKFSTYASWWIKQAVTRHLASHAKTIRLPAHASGLMTRIAELQKEYMDEFGTQPSVEELSDVLGVSASIVESAMSASKMTLSLYAPAGAEEGSSTSRMLKDIIPDDAIEDPGDLLDKEEMAKRIRAAMKNLSPREEKILRLRFGLGEEDGTQEYTISQDELDEIVSKAKTMESK